MKNCKAKILLSALFLCASFSLAAYEVGELSPDFVLNFAAPARSPLMKGYMPEVLASLEPSDVFFIDYYSSEYIPLDGHGYINLFGGLQFRMPYLAIYGFGGLIARPLNIWDKDEKFITIGKVTEGGGGGGLSLKIRYFSLSAFVMYNQIKIEFEERNSFSPDYNADDYRAEGSEIIWSVNPDIYMNKIPYLRQVFRLLKGFIALDNYGFTPNYMAHLYFRDIEFEKFTLDVSVFSSSNWYNYEAKTNKYGVKASFDYGRIFGGDFFCRASIEGGYQNFFDLLLPNDPLYGDGVFIKISGDFGMFFGDIGGFGMQIFFEFEKPQNWRPTFGFVFSLKGGSFGGIGLWNRLNYRPDPFETSERYAEITEAGFKYRFGSAYFDLFR